MGVHLKETVVQRHEKNKLMRNKNKLKTRDRQKKGRGDKRGK